MTRGREANHAHVVTEDNETGLDLLGLAVTRDWVDHPAIARRDQLDPHRPRELEPLHPGEEDSRERMMRRARQRIIERQEQRRRVEPTLGRGTLAAAYDLKVFFLVRGQGSGGCGPADVLESSLPDGGGRRVVRFSDDESDGLSAPGETQQQSEE